MLFPIKIKVVGIGGSGSNAVDRMKKCNLKGVELIAVNADLQDLKKVKADKKIQIGRNLTKGLGTGMDPEKGEKAAEEQREEIEKELSGAEIVFLTCGLGGGCGTGAAPIIADISRKQGGLTIAVVTKPFSFEGRQRMEIAQSGLRKLKEKVDTLITISNDKLSSVLDSHITVSDAFWACDDILRQAVQGIADLIALPGIINVDFADVKAIMKNSGSALFGIGIAKGPQRAEEAVRKSLECPLLEVSYKKAKGILFSISGGRDISLSEIDEAAKMITQRISPGAKVVFGAIQNEKLKEGEMKITVIATGI